MVSTARRALVLVLLLSLALTACGRAGPRVTADDGRSIDRPGSGLWIPETRGGDVDDDVRTLDADDEDEGEDENGRDDGTEPADDDVEAAAPRTSSDTTSDEPRALEPPAPRRPAADDRAPAPTPATESPGDGGDAAPREEQDRSSPEKEARDEDDDPAEPEVVGDCGAAATQEPPARDELEKEVARLRGVVAERWPDTQAGVWILADEERPSVHVGFTRSVRSSLRVACEQFRYPHLLHGVRTELSEAELTEHLEVVLAERDALRDGQPPEDLPRAIRSTEGRYAASVDHAANGVLVTVEEPTERLRDAFRERYTPRLQLTEGRFDEDGELVVDDEE